MNIDIYLDGADIKDIENHVDNPLVKGFTTNPSLLKKAGITDYESFAKDLASLVPKDKTVSLEVVSEDKEGIVREALKLAEISDNFYVKVPIIDTKGVYTKEAIKELSFQGVKLNITAIMAPSQIKGVYTSVNSDTPTIFSVFAGRIADTGLDPMDTMLDCKEEIWNLIESRLLWASTREVLNIYDADSIGCDIITVSSPILEKLKLEGKSLLEYSLETVGQFYKDAKDSGLTL